MVDHVSRLIEEILELRNVRCAVLFGSYARSLFKRPWPSDYLSDLDLQIIADTPAMFYKRLWIPRELQGSCRGYVSRKVSSRARKATIILDSCQIDIVVLRAFDMLLARALMRMNCYEYFRGLRAALREFSDIMRYDHLFVKGDVSWSRFYQKVVGIAGRREMGNQDAWQLVNLARVEGRSALIKLGRGEAYAAQRILNTVIIEANLRLINEIRERCGQCAVHRGRRVEHYLDSSEFRAISFVSGQTAEQLGVEIRQRLEILENLYFSLTGEGVEQQSASEASG